MSNSTNHNAALSHDQMTQQLASYPFYQMENSPEFTEVSAYSAKLWGGQLVPIMANANTSGRFAGAKLTCRETACIGMLALEPGASSIAYYNPNAIENILALENGLEVRYGPNLDQTLVLNKFDMVSIPANLSHSLKNTTNAKVPMVMALNALQADGYSATFIGSNPDIPAAALQKLDIDFTQGNPDSNTIDLGSRVTRFNSLVPYKKSLSKSSIPPEATEILSAGSVFPLIVPEGHVGRSSAAPLNGLPSLYLSIAQCAGDDDGPPPHAHTDTQETFFVLDGEWDICSGFNNEVCLTAKPFDIIPLPPKVMRAFRNRSGKVANLFVIIQGDEKMTDTVLYSESYGKLIESRFGPETIEAYKNIHMKFNAEERLTNNQ